MEINAKMENTLSSLNLLAKHGTYQLIQSEFQLGGENFTSELKGNVEISAASLDYRTKTRKTGK